MPGDVSLRGHENKGVIYAPVVVIGGFVIGALIRVGAQAKQFRETVESPAGLAIRPVHERVAPERQFSNDRSASR